MDTYEIEVAITLRLLSADDTPPVALHPERVQRNGRRSRRAAIDCR